MDVAFVNTEERSKTTETEPNPAEDPAVAVKSALIQICLLL